MAEFHVVPGVVVSGILSQSRPLILETVKNVYLMHEQGLTVNPDSCFLRLPTEKGGCRVIALPAYLGGATEMIGMKWIASFPHNIRAGRPRASAVLVLNDPETGEPVACLEAAGISAARTAASAALAASALVPPGEPVTAAFVGAGVIARAIVDYLAVAGRSIAEVLVHDTDGTSARHLVAHVQTRLGRPAAEGSLSEALQRDLVVFATTALEPYVPADTQLGAGQVLLNISLRDLAPELLLAANNVLDDVEHCLKARTSPHLAEQLSGSRDFVAGTIGGLLRGEVTLDATRPTVFSPFGLGVLDVAVGSHVLAEALSRGSTVPIPGFVGQTCRW